MMKRVVGVRRDDELKWKVRLEELILRIIDVFVLNLNYRIYVEVVKWFVVLMFIFINDLMYD